MQWLQEVWELQSQVDMRVSFKRCTLHKDPGLSSRKYQGLKRLTRIQQRTSQ